MLHVFTIIKFHNLPDYQHIGFTFMYKWSMLFAKCTVQDTHFLSELSPIAAMSTGSIIMRSQKQKQNKKRNLSGVILKCSNMGIYCIQI